FLSRACPTGLNRCRRFIREFRSLEPAGVIGYGYECALWRESVTTSGVGRRDRRGANQPGGASVRVTGVGLAQDGGVNGKNRGGIRSQGFTSRVRARKLGDAEQDHH